jgi:hypothetical protein
MVPCQEKIIPRRYSGATQAFLTRTFRLLIFFKNKQNTAVKKTPVITYVCRKTCPELTYEGQFIFDVYTDWHCIRQEAFCSITKLDRYELPPPSLNTPAIVCLEVMESYTSTVVLYTSKTVAINIYTSCSHVLN